MALKDESSITGESVHKAIRIGLIGGIFVLLISPFVHKGVDKAGNQLKQISNKSLDLTRPWDSFDIYHDLTTKGIQQFVADHKSTLKQSA